MVESLPVRGGVPHGRVVHSDAYGDHAIGCVLNGERKSRHNHIRDAVFIAASQAMLGLVREPEDDRPVDVYIPY